MSRNNKFKKRPASSPKPAPTERSNADSGGATGLPAFLRRKAEASLGEPLGDVRLHSGPAAAASARALGARAYTSGRDIVLGDGPYDERLLAHELAHVVQQSKGTRTAGLNQPGDAFERSADEAADAVVSGAYLEILPAAGVPAIQRQSASHLKPSPMLARAIGSDTVDNFNTNSAALDQDKKVRLGALAASILSLREDYPGCSIDVTGHTDATGPEAFNDALGQKRADAVKEELVANSVPSEIIAASSEGSHQLKIKTAAADGRNRRAEIQFHPESRVRLVPELNLPSPPIVTPAPPPPPRPLAPTKAALEPQWVPLPPAPLPIKAPQSVPSKPLLDGVDKAMDSVLERLRIPDALRPVLKSAAKAGAVKALTAPLDLAMDKGGLNNNEKDAVRTAFKAAIEIAW
jgi:outer membrane protein OmpA-like peptidoglycan-associated protein